jgi:serine/alanine adding enzyme
LIEFGVETKWNEFLSLVPLSLRDIYFSEEYLSLYESGTDSAECFFYRDAGNIYLFPYLKRRHILNESLFYDFETAYGYGGPTSNCTDPDFLQAAEVAFTETCRSAGMIAGFVRFCPWLNNHEMIVDSSRLLFDRKTVLMDLAPDEEEIWSGEIHSKHRNVIRKAEREGLEFEVDEGFEHMGEFSALYLETMKRLGADEFYYFSEEHFSRFGNMMAANAFLGLIRHEGAIVSAAIFMHHGIYGHYHLAGSRADYQKLAPNNLLIYKVALHLKTLGARFFHLGGGSDSSPDNTLFKFKRRFSPTCRYFFVGKFIFDAKQYEEICKDWEMDNPEKQKKFGKLLLKYRY